MRIWPAGDTTTRRHVTVPPEAAQVPTLSIEKSMVIAVATSGRPNPLKTTFDKSLFTASAVGSLVASRLRTMNGVAESDGRAPQWFANAAGSGSVLTIQLGLAVSAQLSSK